MTLLNPAEILWTAAAQILKEQVSEGVWLASFAEATGLYLDENCLTIAVSNPFVRDRIDQRYRELVLAAIADAGYPDLGLELRLNDPEPAASNSEFDQDLAALASDAIAPSPRPTTSASMPDGRPQTSAPETVVAERPTNLNAKYSFESFVTGPSNRFAQAAALSVAETPAR